MKFYTSAIESGDDILLRGYEEGRPFKRKVKYEPTLYVPGKAGSKWKTIHGEPVEPMQFNGMREAKDFIKQYEGVKGFQVHGFPRFAYAFLNEEYPGEIHFDPDLINKVNIDIECKMENGRPDPKTALEEITAITLKKNGIFHCFGCKKFETNRIDVKYHKHRNEVEMLSAFIDVWMDGGYPDVVTGWNISFFDLPYLYKRICNVMNEKIANKLSPWNFVTTRSVTIMGRENISIVLSGISNLDYYEMYRKFTYSQQPSYKLGDIAYLELKESKLDYSEYETLDELYENDFQKYMEYNIHDVELVDKLDDHMKLIEMVYELTYDAKVNMTDVFTQVRMWDVMAHNKLYSRNICVPLENHNHKTEAFEGAHVKDPKIGMHGHIVSLDLDGLYPHLIMQYNIGPDTITDRYVDVTVNDILNPAWKNPIDEDLSLAPNGWCFRKDFQSFLAEMMQDKYNGRVSDKKNMLQAKKDLVAAVTDKEKRDIKKRVSKFNNRQLAKKIQLNSAYGAIGNQHFRFFDLRQATAITVGGQLAIRWAEQEVNDYMNEILGTVGYDYVIASDTDSLYLDMESLVKTVCPPDMPEDKIITFLDKVVKTRIEPKIEEIYERLARRMNAYANKMHMKREAIANRGVWTAKKRYMLNVYDLEGVRFKEPEIKAMGLESVKSSTPTSCRDALKETFKLIMRGDEAAVQDYIAEFKKKFKSLPFEDIASPRGIQDMSSYSLNSKSLPIHVRGALTFNQMILNKKLTKKYEMIQDGEKIKFCYLKMPNPSHQNVIAVLSVLPKEFGMERYIDYDTQFDKAFLQPMKIILDCIGWTDTKVNTLEDFFA